MRIVVDVPGESKSPKKAKGKARSRNSDNPLKKRERAAAAKAMEEGTKEQVSSSMPEQVETPVSNSGYYGSTIDADAVVPAQVTPPVDAGTESVPVTDNPPNEEFQHPVYVVDESKINQPSETDDGQGEVGAASDAEAPATSDEVPTEKISSDAVEQHGPVVHKRMGTDVKNMRRSAKAVEEEQDDSETEEAQEPRRTKKAKKGKAPKKQKPSKAARKYAEEQKRAANMDDEIFADIAKKPSAISIILSVVETAVISAIFGVVGYQLASIMFDNIVRSVMGG